MKLLSMLYRFWRVRTETIQNFVSITDRKLFKYTKKTPQGHFPKSSKSNEFTKVKVT